MGVPAGPRRFHSSFAWGEVVTVRLILRVLTIRGIVAFQGCLSHQAMWGLSFASRAETYFSFLFGSMYCRGIGVALHNVTPLGKDSI